jgi:hypothetical protein
LSRHGDLMSRASLDLLNERLLPTLGQARRASDGLILRLHGRLENVPGHVLRLMDDFAGDDVWREGLGAELDASLTAFRYLK